MTARPGVDEEDAVWIHRVTADALAAAPPRAGALSGWRLAVKDNIDVAGVPTTAGCPEFSYVPSKSAPSVARLVEAGAIFVGKTNMDQFATGLTGSRSPYGALSSVADPNVVSGGSSSGSAVAVARGLADIALGTDTAGSGRVPAALNGIVGLKPTRAFVTTTGVVPACRSIDCVSIFARTCAHARRVLGIVADPPSDHPWPVLRDVRATVTTLGDPRIGVPPAAQLSWFGDREGQSLFDEGVRRLVSLGGRVVEIDLTPFHRAGALLYGGPWVAERFAAVGAFIAANPQAAIDPVVRDVIVAAERIDGAAVFRGAQELADLVGVAAAEWSRMDVLALPTIPRPFTHAEVVADPHGVSAALGTYTNFVNLMDLCALQLPAGAWSSGIPFGLQLIAPAFQDEILIGLGERFEGDERSPTIPEHVRLAVVGAHLTGQPLNHELVGRGARRVTTTTTTPDYRLYALAGTTPAKPGLVRTPDGGSAIEVEVWELGLAEFGGFVAAIPPPLGIGSVELADGTMVRGFVCEPYGLTDARDITRFGGWRAFLASGDALVAAR